MTANTRTPADTGAPAGNSAGPVTAAVLVIGNEILSGRTQDVNLSHIAKRLGAVGIHLREARVVADIPEEIIAAVNALRARYTHVFTTGGIGPTHDDITAACVAKALDLPLQRHPEAWRRLQNYYERIGVPLNAARARMAETPAGAALIDNPVSAAPGFSIRNVHVMAGVPKIMQAMLDFLLPKLAGGPPIRSVTIFSPLPEGTLAGGLAEIQQAWADVQIGSYPAWSMDRFRLSLVLSSTSEEPLNAAAQAVLDLIESLGGKGERALA